MARRRYLVMYDVREQRRLHAVAVCVQGYGDRVQYSVFVCDLSATELFGLRSALDSLIRHDEDSIMVVDLGTAGDASRFAFLGVRPAFPGRRPTVI